MAFCKYCGHQQESSAPFCAGCGKSLAVNNNQPEKHFDFSVASIIFGFLPFLSIIGIILGAIAISENPPFAVEGKKKKQINKTRRYARAGVILGLFNLLILLSYYIVIEMGLT
jgi:uncharacterized membrane protein YvbJ